MPKIVLVTGVSRPLGIRLAHRLLDEPHLEKVIGVDIVEPDNPIDTPDGRFQFIQADIRSPRIASVLRQNEPDAVIHLDVTGVPPHAAGRVVAKEVNVIGTMQLLAACQRAPHVQKLVVRSSTAVYGCSSRDPAMFVETAEPHRVLRGYGKDAADVESYLRGFARRRPDVVLTVARLANVLAGSITTPLARYFAAPAAPTVLGYDARLQFVHPHDAVNVFLKALLEDHPGVFNVAGTGVVLLSQAIRRAGRVPLPMPGILASLAGRLTGLDLSAEQLEFLTYGRVVDTSKLTNDFGYQLEYSTMQTFDAFVRDRQLRSIVSPDNVAAIERRLAAYLGAAR